MSFAIVSSMSAKPVMFPSGRERLVTRRRPTGLFA
jgi:hypothetical protein